MKTILLATDGSPSAQKATETALELAGATGWRLRVVSVWHTIVHAYGAVPMAYADISDAEREHARSVLEETIHLADAAGVRATAQLRKGDAVEEICAAAHESGAELIVLGAHGWGPLRRLLFGSVSSGVLHEASCPVLVVRGVTEAEERVPVTAAGTAARPAQ
jgi:nucleotide-binding universal stress UspA family protein